MQKLNAREIKCLEEMAKMTGPYYWMPKTTETLKQKGLAEPAPIGGGFGAGVRITQAGRDFLKGFPNA